MKLTASKAEATELCMYMHCMQELSEEKKRLEKELDLTRAKNEEQKKFISVVKSAVSHLS
jgi:hypothetical protein